MMPNLRCLVAKAYRVRQVRAFCSSFSSSAPNPIGDKGGNCIVRYLVSRGVIMMMGFGAGTYGSGDNTTRKHRDTEGKNRRYVVGIAYRRKKSSEISPRKFRGNKIPRKLRETYVRRMVPRNKPMVKSSEVSTKHSSECLSENSE
ncbi:unnamed protein product, partial [Brassica rapa subsp. trilocularis]